MSNSIRYQAFICGLLAGIFLLYGSQMAAARQGTPPLSTIAPVQPLAEVAVLEVPAIEPELLLAEDKTRGGATAKPLRFAVVHEVDVAFTSHGSWHHLADGRRLWRLRVHAPNATDLSFGFSSFRLPAGATLHVIGEDGAYFRGPYGAADNKPHGQLWTPVVPGSWAVLELLLPPRPAFMPELVLREVWRGYRDLLTKILGSGDQGRCNIDVICSEADEWRSEIRSVAHYAVAGYVCTGSLVMNTRRDFRNLFLTAHHCPVNASTAPGMVFYWNYESPECGMLGNGFRGHTQTGATYLAGREDNDFTLVELEDEPESEFNVYYAGWDATGATPAHSVCIHHPRGGEKAFTYNDDPLTSGEHCATNTPFGPDTHWWVDNWELGTTEGGSSGGGLFDPDTHLLVGYLTGGLASCTNIDYDCFGKLAVGWDGDTTATRLRDWLDPDNTGVLTLAGADPLPRISYITHRGADACAVGSPGDNGVWEPGEQITLSVDLAASGSFSNVQGTLTSSTPGVIIDTPVATWPDLDQGDTVTNREPGFSVQLPQSLACYSEVAFDLEVTSAEGEPLQASFSHQVGRRLAPEESMPLEIPDDSDVHSVSSTLVVADQPDNNVIEDVDVSVSITHTYVGDLTIVLQSPAGTSVTLLDRPGVPGISDYGCNNNDMEITFDDDAEVDVENHCADEMPWFSGRARPAEPLAALESEPLEGSWVLTVTDSATPDAGVINSWGIVTDPPVSGQCAVCTADVLRPRRVTGRVGHE